MANGLHEKNLAQSETLCTWRRSLRGTWEISSMPGLLPGRLGKAESRTPSMHVDEKSDEAIVPRKRPNKERQLSAEVVEGRASPKGNSRQTAVVRTLSRVTASIRSAAVRRTAGGFKPCAPTFDPREEILCRCSGRGDTGSV